MKLSRRNFITNSAFGVAGIASIPLILSSCLNKGPKSNEYEGLNAKRNTLLFQGDSVTDARRNRKKPGPNDACSFGPGFAFLIASDLLRNKPEFGMRIYNRGVGGNKVFQLMERWEEDCILLKPDVINILIGVNDYWHTRDNRFSYDGDQSVYRDDYHQLVLQTKEALPEAKIIICEPFTVPGMVVTPDFQAGFEPYREAAREIAFNHDLLFIPYQKIFDEACRHAQAEYWSLDGIHPSMAGCYLMAEAWLEMVI